FFSAAASPYISTLSLHDALPISLAHILSIMLLPLYRGFFHFCLTFQYHCLTNDILRNEISIVCKTYHDWLLAFFSFQGQETSFFRTYLNHLTLNFSSIGFCSS